MQAPPPFAAGNVKFVTPLSITSDDGTTTRVDSSLFVLERMESHGAATLLVVELN